MARINCYFSNSVLQSTTVCVWLRIIANDIDVVHHRAVQWQTELKRCFVHKICIWCIWYSLTSFCCRARCCYCDGCKSTRCIFTEPQVTKHLPSICRRFERECAREPNRDSYALLDSRLSARLYRFALRFYRIGIYGKLHVSRRVRFVCAMIIVGIIYCYYRCDR